MKRAKKLKLYVWEDVLSDYTSGIAFALAENSTEARQMICKELGGDHQDLCKEPMEINEKEAFFLYGGG